MNEGGIEKRKVLMYILALAWLIFAISYAISIHDSVVDVERFDSPIHTHHESILTEPKTTLTTLTNYTASPVMFGVTNFNDVKEIRVFLEEDKTNRNQYNNSYRCGHFARELSANAKEQNISIGSALLSNHPIFKGSLNHVVNYVYINDEMVFIDARGDRLMHFHSIFFEYEYVRLYPDGTQVPSYWKYNLAPTFSYYDTKGYDVNER